MTKKLLSSAMCVVMSATLLFGCNVPSLNETSEIDISSDLSSSELPGNASTIASTEVIASIENSSSIASSGGNSSDSTTTEISNSASSASTVVKPPFLNGNEPVPDGDMHIVFIGDSQFDRWRGSGTSISELVSSKLNATTYNLGVGGTCAAVERTQNDFVDEGDYEEANFTAVTHMLKGDLSTNYYPNSLSEEFPTILESIEPKIIDYYVIEYGYNDYYSGLDLKDENNLYDEHTYYGALNTGIKMLKEISPSARFIICTPCYCRFYNGKGEDMGDCYNVTKGLGPLAVYGNEALVLADALGCCKLDTESGYAFDLDSHTYKEYLEDPVHLSNRGRQVYADALIMVIKKNLGILGDSSNDKFYISDYTEMPTNQQ